MTTIRVVDTDTHLTEPPDLWTSRLPKKWRALAPRVEVHPETLEHRWRIGDTWVSKVGNFSPAGGTTPATFDEIDPACYDAQARLAWMDKHGIHTQVLYPNIVALEGHAIQKLPDPDMQLAVIRASNDHHSDFVSEAPGRFVALTALPFWDLDATIAEMERCKGRGHRGVVWAATLIKHGLPGTSDPYWDPFYAAAQDLELSINFHVGVGYTDEQISIARSGNVHRDIDAAAMRTAIGFMANGRTIADIIMNGLCERFPRLNFVSVESGFGFVPYLLEALDWQWSNSGGLATSKLTMRPSDYFRRQIYAMFWFEESTLPLLTLYPDNVMFETDFPHDTSLTPGSASVAEPPEEIIARHIEKYGPDLMEKVLWKNAARLYQLD